MKEDWIESTLGEVSDVGAGSPAPQDQEYFEQGTIPFIRVKDMGKLGNNKFISDAEDYLNERGTENLKLIPKGSLLFTKSGASTLLNQRALINKDMFVVSHIGTATPSGVITSNYLYYKMKLVDFAIFAHATTLPSLPLSKAKSIKIPIAPLPEQRAIVAKIEALFSSLDSGIADLKKAQKQLKIYRKAVLKKAFDGELIGDKVKPELVSLGTLIDKPRYGSSKKCELKVKGKAVLRIPNIGNGIIDTSELKYAEFDEREISTLALQEGDILTIRSNGSVDLVGKCALVTKTDLDFLYAGYLIRLRPHSDKINSKYLLHCLSSHNLRVQIESKAKSTSGVNNINSGELESLEIPLFSMEEQNQIVQEIESRLSVCDAVEQNITESLEKAQALRQSILKKAFEGKLLTQEEIEKCKAHPDYEPASVLLERIKKEK